LTLQRLNPPDRYVEVLLKKFLENIYQDAKPSSEKRAPRPLNSAAALSRSISSPKLSCRRQSNPFQLSSQRA
jgi:hypothetical protein